MSDRRVRLLRRDGVSRAGNDTSDAAAVMEASSPVERGGSDTSSGWVGDTISIERACERSGTEREMQKDRRHLTMEDGWTLVKSEGETDTCDAADIEFLIIRLNEPGDVARW